MPKLPAFCPSIRTFSLLAVLPALCRAGGLRFELELNTAAIGTNLAPNPSFEKVENGVPRGWRFSPRNTNATFALISDACSGRYAAHFANGTPQMPQVYGQLVLNVPLKLTPGTTYTLSCYARSEDPGPAWIGGGHLVLIGECLTVDEYGRKHAGNLLPVGDRVTRIAAGPARELVAPLDSAETAAGIVRPVRCLQPDGKPAWPIECRTVTIGGKTVVSLVGLNKAPCRVHLNANPQVRSWRDLLTDAGGISSSFTIRPLEVRLLKAENE